jgi:hypothetical protein
MLSLEVLVAISLSTLEVNLLKRYLIGPERGQLTQETYFSITSTKKLKIG